MELALTWNLVLLSLITLIFAFGFILGQKSTIKLILSTYIAILTADGLVDFFQKFVFVHIPGLQSLVYNIEMELFMWMRVIIFILSIIILVVKGGFHVSVGHHDHWAGRTVVHTLFSALAAFLMMATMLIYLSGNSFVEGILYASQINIYQESFFAQVLIDFYQIWFSLPAISFLVASFFLDPTED